MFFKIFQEIQVLPFELFYFSLECIRTCQDFELSPKALWFIGVISIRGVGHRGNGYGYVGPLVMKPLLPLLPLCCIPSS